MKENFHQKYKEKAVLKKPNSFCTVPRISTILCRNNSVFYYPFSTS